MRPLGYALTGILCAWAATASAGPRMDSLAPTAEATLVEVHHKPGHKGGPPWMRQNQNRDAWRDSRSRQGYSDGYADRRTVCRTTYRTYFDDYSGEYVRRSVRVCD